jgi:hypothetical protein
LKELQRLVRSFIFLLPRRRKEFEDFGVDFEFYLCFPQEIRKLEYFELDLFLDVPCFASSKWRGEKIPTMKVAFLVPSVLLAIFVVVLLHYLLDFFFFNVFKTKAHSFPPGPWAWPVVGNLFQLGEFPHQTLARLAQRYGPLMHLRFGPMHTMVVSSPAMAKEFLKTHDHLFQDRQLFLSTEILNDNCSIATSSGAYWRHLRKICLTELFSPKRLQSFQAMRSKELNSTMKSIRIQAGEGKLLDLNFQLTSLTSNIMTQTLFRKRL